MLYAGGCLPACAETVGRVPSLRLATRKCYDLLVKAPSAPRSLRDGAAPALRLRDATGAGRGAHVGRERDNVSSRSGRWTGVCLCVCVISTDARRKPPCFRGATTWPRDGGGQPAPARGLGQARSSASGARPARIRIGDNLAACTILHMLGAIVLRTTPYEHISA